MIETLLGLSDLEIYFISLTVGLLTSWAIQIFDNNSSEGFAMSLGLVSLLPLVNIIVLMAVGVIIIFLITLSVIMLPTAIKEILRFWRNY